MIKKDFLKAGKVCKATFSLPKEAAVDAKEVFLLGDFNNWDVENPAKMKKQKDGSFATTLELEAGKYQFRYLIDKNTWENDWNADDYIPVPNFGIYNSVVNLEETVATSIGTTKAAPKAKVEKKAPAAKKETEKKVTAKAVAAVADDLKKIEGVGPKIATLLAKAGITTFEGLAKAEIKVLKDVLASAGPRFKMHDPSTWTEQAQLASKGEWTKLEKLQGELKGGKKK